MNENQINNETIFTFESKTTDQTFSSLTKAEVLMYRFLCRYDVFSQIDAAQRAFYLGLRRAKTKKVDQSLIWNETRSKRIRILFPSELPESVFNMFESKLKPGFNAQFVLLPFSDIVKIYQQEMTIKKPKPNKLIL